MKERHDAQRQRNIGQTRDLASSPTRENSSLPTPVSPLNQMRKTKKLRQSDLALVANVTQGHFSEVENGIAMPNEKLSRFLEAMGLLKPQEEFVRMRQMQTKRKLEHQLNVRRGGDVHEVRKSLREA